jgi:ABC-type sugar transport system permease subunit
VPYSQMLFGAALSAALAVAVVAVVGRNRRVALLLTVAVTTFVMPLAWNLILRRTGATGSFSHDLPFKPFPISWQDTGSGVFTLAGAALALGLGAARREAPSQVIQLALVTALAALLTDVYAY